MLQHLTPAEIVSALRFIATLYVEVETGLRPARAMARYATPELLHQLRTNRVATARGTVYTAERAGRVHYTFRTDRAGSRTGLDAVVVLHRGDGTVRVLAMDLEPVEGQWKLAQADRPEHRVRP